MQVRGLRWLKRIATNWPLSNKAPLVENPCRSVYITQKMAADGEFPTPSDTIMWAISEFEKKPSFGGQSPPNFVLVHQIFCVGGPDVHQTSGGHLENFALYHLMS